MVLPATRALAVVPLGVHASRIALVQRRVALEADRPDNRPKLPSAIARYEDAPTVALAHWNVPEFVREHLLVHRLQAAKFIARTVEIAPVVLHRFRPFGAHQRGHTSPDRRAALGGPARTVYMPK